MSTEHDKNKVFIDDEKVIAALYAELETELENAQENELTTTTPTDKLFSEQPSESLDQRILAAAHKAVESNPKVIDLAGEKSSLIRKSRAWYVPLSLAASMVLVVSLVVNQGEQSVLPNRDVMFEPSTVQIEQSLSNESVGIVERKVMAQGQSRDLANKDSRQAMKNAKRSVQNLAQVPAHIPAQAPIQAAKSQDHEVAVEMFALPAIKAPQHGVSPEIQVRSITSEEIASLEEKSSESTLKGSSPMPLLSLQQYQLYKEQNKQWLLLNESEQYYLIDVFDSEQKLTQYKLLKKYFYISDLTIGLAGDLVSNLAKDIEHKHSFDQIEVLDEK